MDTSDKHLGQLLPSDVSGNMWEESGDIWLASGDSCSKRLLEVSKDLWRHLEGISGASGNIWEASRNHLETSGGFISEECGIHLGTSGLHLGRIWEASGRRFKRFWEAPGGHAALEANVTKKRICCYYERARTTGSRAREQPDPDDLRSPLEQPDLHDLRRLRTKVSRQFVSATSRNLYSLLIYLPEAIGMNIIGE